MITGLMIPDDHPWSEEAHNLGTVAWHGDADSLPAATRAPLDVLAVDGSTLTAAHLAALRSFRVARPATRIVVRLPDEAQPGDPRWSGLVNLGIYDLAEAGQSLAETLDRHPSYADAVRWTGYEPDSAGPQSKPKPEIREVVREKRVATSSRPVLIAVHSLSPGAGCTATAIQVSRTLAQHGHTVALTECGLGLDPEDPEVVGVTVFPVADGLDAGILLRRREWAYVVCDGGTGGAVPAEADLVLWILPGSIARAKRDWAQPLPETGGAPVVAVAGPGPDSAAVAQEWMQSDRGPAFAWPTGKKTSQMWQSILAPVWPDIKGRKPWWTKRSAPKAPPEPEAAPQLPPQPPPAEDGWQPIPMHRWQDPPAGWPVYHEPPHPGYRLAALIDWALMGVMVAAAVFVGGLLAQAGLVSGPVGTALGHAQRWELHVFTALSRVVH